MEGVTVIETKVLQNLIGSIEDLKITVSSKISELDGINDKYLTISDVMDLTGLSRSTVDKFRDSIGFTNSGNCVRFKRSDVIEFMDRNYYKTSKRK
ncbi:helix-turn-helix domain-containing protein [Pedobacter antarcticus]|uniref:helix-turn-helix domain-containing protein n=1 Tax=Pedobacter antarcticus TaxID=34086 RepID=UPI0029300D8F|nr:helix-turn-helix domain-containing protein [Pedobacter antarcticus]